jgi:hypothetical protein
VCVLTKKPWATEWLIGVDAAVEAVNAVGDVAHQFADITLTFALHNLQQMIQAYFESLQILHVPNTVDQHPADCF